MQKLIVLNAQLRQMLQTFHRIIITCFEPRRRIWTDISVEQTLTTQLILNLSHRLVLPRIKLFHVSLRFLGEFVQIVSGSGILSDTNTSSDLIERGSFPEVS